MDDKRAVQGVEVEMADPGGSTPIHDHLAQQAHKSEPVKGQATIRMRPTPKQARQLKKPCKTANGRIIRDLMITNGIRGSYKDYVVVAGDRLMDWTGSYDMVKDGKPLRAEAVALVHKSKLHNIIGADNAQAFWRPGIGRVNAASRNVIGSPKHLEAKKDG